MFRHLMKVCGKAGCRCAQDRDARHGPYYQWGHMKGGKLVHRTVSPEQVAILRLAIGNYRKAKKLMKAWEDETKQFIDNENPAKSSLSEGQKNYTEIRSTTCGK
jgi:hypothetical protein